MQAMSIFYGDAVIYGSEHTVYLIYFPKITKF